jgi:DNA repair photolyase
LLQVLWEHRNPVSIITKNALILRDLDIIENLAKEQLVHVAVSITGLDEDLRQKMEPRTVPYKRRLEVIRRLTAIGVPVTVMVAPIIPSLNSHEIPAVIEAAAEAGAINAGYTIVRLNGALQPIFKDWLKHTFPDRASKVLKHIADAHGGQLNDSRFGSRMRGEGQFAEQIAQLVHLAKQRHMSGGRSVPYNFNAFRRNPAAQLLF